MTLPFVHSVPQGSVVLMHPQHPWDLNQQIRVRLKTMTQGFPNSLPLCIYLSIVFPAVFPFSPSLSLSTTTFC